MNDFTKEELKLLINSMESWLDSSCEHPEYEAHLLQNKLKQMIDNYCDHKDEYVDSNYFTGCMDCGKKW